MSLFFSVAYRFGFWVSLIFRFSEMGRDQFQILFSLDSFRFFIDLG